MPLFLLLCTDMYSWLITFEIFRIFFFVIDGWWVGCIVSKLFFGVLYIFYIYKAPNLLLSLATWFSVVGTQSVAMGLHSSKEVVTEAITLCALQSAIITIHF